MVKKVQKSKLSLRNYKKQKMCITFFCMRPHSDSSMKLLIGFNRDEQSKRETLPFGSFEDDKFIYGGKDVPTNGSWLGLNIKTGIMVILTNYDLPYLREGKSRGRVVRKLLDTSFIPEQMKDPKDISNKIKHQLQEILKEDQSYKPFNLLVYNMREEVMFYICTEIKMKEVEILEKNKNYSLCNSDLHTEWPKTEHGLKIFDEFVEQLSKKENKDDLQILTQLNQKLMRDKKAFSEDPDDQSSIFLDPFYSKIQEAQRETKQTFLCVIREENILCQEITYENYHASKVSLDLNLV